MNKHNANTTYEISQLIRALEYQHPLGVSTFGPCVRCHKKGARGGNVCADCVENELAELIGKSMAWEVHQALKTYNRIKNEAMYGDEK